MVWTLGMLLLLACRLTSHMCEFSFHVYGLLFHLSGLSSLMCVKVLSCVPTSLAGFKKKKRRKKDEAVSYFWIRHMWKIRQAYACNIRLFWQLIHANTISWKINTLFDLVPELSNIRRLSVDEEVSRRWNLDIYTCWRKCLLWNRFYSEIFIKTLPCSKDPYSASSQSIPFQRFLSSFWLIFLPDAI